MPQQVEAKRLCSSLCKVKNLIQTNVNRNAQGEAIKLQNLFDITFCLGLS